MHIQVSPPPEKGTACPAQDWRGEEAWALQLEFLFMPLSREKKDSGAILASLSYTSGQLTSSQGEVIWTQPPSYKALSAETRHMVLFCIRHWLQLRRTLTRLPCVYHPPLHPTCSVLPFPLPHQALLWFFDDFPFV